MKKLKLPEDHVQRLCTFPLTTIFKEIYGLAINTEKTLLATSNGPYVVIYKVTEAGPLSTTLFKDNEQIYCCEWISKSTLATGSHSGNIRILDAQNMKQIHGFSAHYSAVHCIKANRSRSAFLSVGGDGRLRIWSPSGECFGEWGVSCAILTAAWLENDKDIMLGATDGRFYRITTDDPHHMQPMKNIHKSPNLFKCLWSSQAQIRIHSSLIDWLVPVGPLILSKSIDSQVILWRPLENGSRKIHIVKVFSYLQGESYWSRFCVEKGDQAEHLSLSFLVGGDDGTVWKCKAYPTNEKSNRASDQGSTPLDRIFKCGNSVVRQICCCEHWVYVASSKYLYYMPR